MRLEPRLLVYSAGDKDASRMVEAASRVGALGVFDLAWNDSAGLTTALPDLRRLARRFDRTFAVRVDARFVTHAWLASLPTTASTIIAVAHTLEGSELGQALGLIQSSNRIAWAEVISREAATLAETAGATSLIVVGHEAGGMVGDDSSFILMQAVVSAARVPVWVRGGVGPRVAAGCLAAGAAGVVLDGSALLTRESNLSASDRLRVERWDGGETRVFGPPDGVRVRVHVAPGSPLVGRLRAASEAGGTTWEAAVRTEVGWNPGQAWPVGQDSALASGLARKWPTIAELVRAVGRAIDQNSSPAASPAINPLAEASSLARAHRTRYPIIQGPMTRVSDVVDFADAVAEGGALPFLALAMLRGGEVESLLERASVAMEGKSWGVGLLGFVSPELRREQVAAVLAARPPFALIAGGRPDQALELDRVGIATYLHVPSPGLLDQFVREGARRFVLEGRECGGHVGPRSSFVLWEQALDVVERAIHDGASASDFQIIFAGGVHDSRSARFVATLAAPIARQGVKVGVLVGTGYLFTREAVATGAIVERYQAEAIRCARTVLLETGPGHEIRVGPSPFVAAFGTNRDQLRAEGVSSEVARATLEQLNAGRLRVATKGVERRDGLGSPLVQVAPLDQFDRGIYMFGQVATLRNQITTIAELHRSIAENETRVERSQPKPKPSDIAIVGMSAILPGADDVRTFWENTLRKHDAVIEIPPDRWDWRLYYDSDPKAPDKVVSKWGGFVPDVPFDPLSYGMPPSSLPSIEPVQLLLLEATRAAIEDAGYADRPFDRERTAVVLGMGGGAAQLAMGYAFRSYLPMLDGVSPGSGQAALDACQGLLPEWTEDSFPGFLLNVAAGRVANRFDLGGANYTVDAACGSSLAAATLAVRELESGSADVVLLGGADTVQNPFTYLAFSKTHAFSPRGRCRPFDASADGIVISEGVAMVVLKRLSDAERDGDRIYAVIKGIGASSDGRARGLTAPSPDGQVRAVERAYQKSGIEPATVGYVEAHGTGTAVGDVVEVNAISGVFRSRGAVSGSVAIGSVKSMIGHTKCAAGLAGLINASLALHHRVFPPTIGVETANPKADLADGPFRVSTEARPWLQANPGQPRRAGVSAFGFGGTNFHAVLESFDANQTPAMAPRRDWPAELFVWRPESRTLLADNLRSLLSSITGGARPPLRDLARAVNAANPASDSSEPRPTLAIVASSLDDLVARLQIAQTAIDDGQTRLDDPRGIFYQERPEFVGHRVAFLFPGQGSQSVGMLSELAMTFAEILEAFETFDLATTSDKRPAVGPFVFPSPHTDDAGRDQARAALAMTDKAQPALGASSVGLLRLLGSFGIEADLFAGHSFGELVALHAAGSVGVESLARLAHERGRLMLAALGDSPGAMAAVAAGVDAVAPLLGSFGAVAAVNENGPHQTVIGGPQPALSQAVAALKASGFQVKELAVGGAFHTDLVSRVQAPLTSAARSAINTSPDRPVYSNLDARPHPSDIQSIAERIGQHAVRPVRFASMVEAMHLDGARIFVEVGPGSVLTGLVGSILGDRPHLAVACDSSSRPGVPTLLTALARLAVSGVPVRLDRLSEGRSTRILDLANLAVGDGSPPLSTNTWLVNGSRSRPIGQAEPRRLGQSAEYLGLAAPVDRGGEPASAVAMASIRNGHVANGIGHPTLNGNGHHSLGDPSNGKVMTPPKPSEVSSLKPAPLSNPSAGGSSDERVLGSFQETMRLFLDVQRSTMLAYLGGRSGSSVGSVPAPQPHAAQAPIASIPVPPHAPVVLPSAIIDRMTGQPNPLAAAALTQAATTIKTPPAPVTSTPLAETVGPMGRDAVAARLIEIVRDRTGYPAEMLGLELDLEADLGIDSIKRVEILGSLRDSVAALAASTDSSSMESLSRAKTLGAIVDRVAEIDRCPPVRSAEKATNGATAREARPSSVAANQVEDADSDPDPASSSGESSNVRRLVIESVAAPLASFGAEGGLTPGGVVVVSDDGRGVARALITRFEAEGHPVVLAGPATFNLGSPASVDLLLEKARAKGPLAAIVHAAPLRELGEAGLDPERWAARMKPEVQGLFLLAKGAAADLERASRRGGGGLIAATAMCGSFGSIDSRNAPFNFFPGHGGVAGLIKTLAREWPGVRTRVVDLDPRDQASILAGRLFDEALTNDGWSEVGYLHGSRVRLQTKPAPLDRSQPARLDLKPGEPVLITGGARGITAAVALELARQWRPTLMLLGRSPLPTAVEDPQTAGIEPTLELKAAILDSFRRSGASISPAELDRAERSIRQAREIRSNLDAIRDAGSIVEYVQADVRDANSLGAVLGDWRRKHGHPIGLIHGAGVIQDKLIRDKSLGSFDAVLGTKLDGALNLARLLNPDALRFAALFSSIAGRFGNAGQSDYAAANEVLNKLALWLDRRWPGRVLAMNWGPWSGVGMVSDLEGHLGSRGLGMIPPEVGRARLLDELRFGSKGQVEVMLAGNLGNLDGPIEGLIPSQSMASASPILGTAR